MKFARLYLTAFGAFTQRRLDFPSTAEGDFHLVFGRNEAGKSTVLRAVTAFLFGFPERTGDAFRHDYAALRVGATLLHADGTRLSAMRRKARKATLFRIDEATDTEITDRPLPEAAVADGLGGLDVALYQSLFGLDLDGLVRGSDELLRGEGDVGRSLFQAAAGLANLRAVMAGFDDEAAAVFKARGSTGRLNRALAQFDDERRTLKEATTPTSAWKAAERNARQASDRLARLRSTLQERRAEERRLQRIRGNLPLVTERAAKRNEVERLAHVPRLDSDAGALRAAAMTKVRGAEAARGNAQARLAQHESEAAALVVRDDVLAQASGIAQLVRTVEGYRAARDALPGLRREADSLATEIAALLRGMGSTQSIDHAFELLPRETLVARVQARLEEHSRLTEREAQLAAQLRAVEIEVERRRAELAEGSVPAALDALEAAVDSAAHVGVWEARARELDALLGVEEARLATEVAALWSRSLSELLALTVPLPETAAHFEREFAAQAADEQRVEAAKADLARDCDARRRELETLAAAGEVITHADVVAARAERDRRWDDLRRAWIEREARATPPAADANAARGSITRFEAAIQEADRRADLLHADTARATHAAAIRERIAAMETEIARHDHDAATLVLRRRELEQRWEIVVSPLRRSDLTPAALREWLNRHQRVVDKCADVERVRAERSVAAADAAGARARLAAALRACGLVHPAPDASGVALLDRAQEAIRAAQRTWAMHDARSTELKAKSDDLARLQRASAVLAEELRAWQQDWRALTASLHLTADALPDEVRVRLDELARLSRALSAWRACTTQIATHDAVVLDFEAGVARVTDATAWKTHGQGADTLAEALHEALEAARAARTRQQHLDAAIVQERRAIDDEAGAVAAANETLAALVRAAGCARPEELPDIEAQAARKRTLDERLDEIDEALLRQNARPVAEVVHECGGVTLESVERALADNETAIVGLDADIAAAQAAAHGTEAALAAIDGGIAAAAAQQALRETAARVAHEARCYARARLASAVLGRVVQAYRDRHQGPLLARAAEIFAQVTLGSFSGLVIDHLDDRQVLLGVRPDTTHVPVAGMSQGTRDQLFLSLRLAAVEEHIVGRGPFPVIVDDLLVQFDDARALAALGVLCELGRKTQVLFFTHHEHLVDLVTRSPLAAAVTMHRL
ncbi:MAG: AAA family ATPase [Burkholderiales bacterium]|nr:AAA family ATPase [Burkholderiales bacterium]